MLERAYDTVEQIGVGTGLHRRRTGNYDAIVMYHSVRHSDRVRPGTSDLTPGELRAHLTYLDDHFEIVDVRTVADTTDSGEKRVALTFDDGYRDFVTTVLPILHEFDAPATAFVVPGFLEGDVRRLQAANAGHVFETLTTTDLEALADDPLVTLGNHTRTHHDLGLHHEEDIIREEVIGGKDLLEERFSVDIDLFCYPRGNFNETSLQIVKESHALAVQAESRRCLHPSDDRYVLPRVDGGAGLRAVAWRTADLNVPLVRTAGRRFGIGSLG